MRNDIFRDDYVAWTTVAGIVSIIFLTLLAVFLFARGGEGRGPVRYFALFLLNIYVTSLFTTLASSVYLLPGRVRESTVLNSLSYFFGVALFLSLWLYQKQFMKASVVTRAVTGLIILALALYAAALFINGTHPIMFRITEEGAYDIGVVDHISVGIDFFCLTLLCVATLASGLNRSRKVAFLCCIFSPVLFAVLSLNQEFFKRNIYVGGLVLCSVVLPLSLMFFGTHDELENDVLRQQEKQAKLRISAMISQMQPHFLYNSLAVIEALCEEDPRLAAKATNAFSSYLRENMDFANKSDPISFSEELDHIKTYVWLEKLRFPQKLNVEYDIRCTAFPVPALSVQPMVENAIKHGICRSKDGGTVRVCSAEADRFYSVTVSDDGVGFDVFRMRDEDGQHLGIRNTRCRIQDMMCGSLDIMSAPGKGTTVTIRIPKGIGAGRAHVS